MSSACSELNILFYVFFFLEFVMLIHDVGFLCILCLQRFD